MTRTSITAAAGIRGLVVAGLLGAAALTGIGTAHAEPAPATGSTATIPAAGNCQTFWPSPYQVCGEIRDLYVSLGGAQSALSFPSGAEVTNPDGSKYSTFLNGVIRWSPVPTSPDPHRGRIEETLSCIHGHSRSGRA